MKKRIITLALALVLVLVFLPAAPASAADITVIFEDEPIVFANQGPVTIDGRTLVPVRGVFETLGFVVSYEASTQTVTLRSDDYTVIMVIGESVFTTNGKEYTLDVPAQIIEGSTMVPIRLPLESAGFTMVYNSENFTIIIAKVIEEPEPAQEAEVRVPFEQAGEWLEIGVAATLGMADVAENGEISFDGRDLHASARRTFKLNDKYQALEFKIVNLAIDGNGNRTSGQFPADFHGGFLEIVLFFEKDDFIGGDPIMGNLVFIGLPRSADGDIMEINIGGVPGHSVAYLSIGYRILDGLEDVLVTQISDAYFIK